MAKKPEPQQQQTNKKKKNPQQFTTTQFLHKIFNTKKMHNID